MLGSAFNENTLQWKKTQWKKTVEIGTESAILVQVLSVCLFVCLFFNGKMVVIKMLNAMHVHNSTRKNGFIILFCGMWKKRKNSTALII